MTDTSIYAAFIFLSLLFYIPSLLYSRYFSGKRFSLFIIWPVLAYNVALGNIHVQFIKLSILPVFGAVDNSILGWLSYFLVFAHGFSLPSPKERKTNPNIIK